MSKITISGSEYKEFRINFLRNKGTAKENLYGLSFYNHFNLRRYVNHPEIEELLKSDINRTYDIIRNNFIIV